MRFHFSPLSVLLALLACGCAAQAAQTADAEGPAFPLLGTIKARSAAEIQSSWWSIGGETLDRDFAVYANYKQYLGPLGAKAIRLQAGWAKCEKTRGVYDWAWLDEIIADALAQGVQPWLETSYGNPLYPEGGGTGLGGGLPRSPEALAAWDAWVRALVARYRDRVREWEVWNEPDLGKASLPADYASLFIRTAEIIRGEQPRARLYALGLAGNLAFAESFLERMKQQGKLGLIDAITIHGYPKNPDDTSNVDKLRTLAARYAPSIQARQGETGAPSGETVGALRDVPWTEQKQAKWNLRRMLAHHGKDVPFNLFTLCELRYAQKGMSGMNRKGLLRCNEDLTVAGPKPAYCAAQRVFAIFDDTLERIRDLRFSTSATAKLAVFGYRKKGSGALVVAVWCSGAAPGESNAPTPVDLTFSGAEFTAPVYADLLTGRVYEVPRERWASAGAVVTFKQLPLYDAPALIAEKAALLIEKKEGSR